MKRFLFALLALCSMSAAFATDIITLVPDAPFQCWNIGTCYQPPTYTNTTKVVEYLQVACGAGCVAVGIDGVRYYATGIDNLPTAGLINIDNAYLYGPDGSYVVLNAQLSYRTFLGGSGRAHYWIHRYVLLNGAIILP